MKLLTALLATLAPAHAIQQQADIFYHQKEPLGPSMWHFSGDGLTIFSPEGEVLKAHPKKSICRTYTGWGGSVSEDCYFFAYASDGHKYVWATALGGGHRVEAFDIDSGDYAGYIDTCSTPIDLQYHASREEMWLRCAQKTTDHMGEVDVFSSNSLSTPLEMVYLNATARPYGRLAVDSMMGNQGFVTAYNLGELYELDLSSKEVKETYEIPDAYGLYDMTFSPTNHHLFFRARVCCACDDLKDGCGNPQQVIVKTGPNKSSTPQDGACSSTCEGSKADTIGVVEFDTVNKAIVATHNIKEGTGHGADPIASPDGKYVMLMGNDGGQHIRVLKTRDNGKSSVLAADIPVNFKNGEPDKTVVSDFAFVTDATRNIMIIGASTDNEVVLVDLNDNYRTARINLAPSVEESTGGSSRKIEWAIDTDYVWVSGGESKEQYIIDLKGGIKNAHVHRTITDIASGNMMFVDNYKRKRDVARMNSVAAQVSESNSSSKSTSSSSSNTLGMVSLIIGIVAIAGVLGLAMMMKKGGSTTSSSNKEEFSDEPDVKTLGSKVVN